MSIFADATEAQHGAGVSRPDRTISDERGVARVAAAPGANDTRIRRGLPRGFPGTAREFRLAEWDEGSAVFVAMNAITPDRLVYARRHEQLRVEITGVPPFYFRRAN